MSTEWIQTCPRRINEFGPWDKRPGLDRWATGHALGGNEPAGPSCSFCGSLEPGRFLELAGAGWWVEPTDKNYKVYLATALTPEQIEQQRQDWLRLPLAVAVRRTAERAGMSQEGIEEELAAQWQTFPASSGRGHTVAKFYLQHLDVPGQDRFIELANTRTMKIGYPGFFYVAPFFTKHDVDPVT